MTHTPTPWRFTDDGRATTVRADNAAYPKPIAEIWDNGDSREDNAVFIVTAVNAYDKQRALIETLTAALDECEDYFDNRADADCDQDGYIPNEEMKRLATVRDALDAAKKEGF